MGSPNSGKRTFKQYEFGPLYELEVCRSAESRHSGMATQGRKGTKEVQAPGLFSLFSLSDSSLIFPWTQFCEKFCASLKSLMVLVGRITGSATKA
jgi:hypothetical protein